MRRTQGSCRLGEMRDTDLFVAAARCSRRVMNKIEQNRLTHQNNIRRRTTGIPIGSGSRLAPFLPQEPPTRGPAATEGGKRGSTSPNRQESSACMLPSFMATSENSALRRASTFPGSTTVKLLGQTASVQKENFKRVDRHHRAG
jgi:hypothetical protein